MPEPNKLTRFFSSSEPLELDVVVRRAIEMSDEVRLHPAKPRKGRSQRTELTRNILAVAPAFRGRRYDAAGIARKILGDSGKAADEIEVAKLSRAVANGIARLRRSRELPAPFTSPPKLREATPADMKRHRGLVINVARTGHRFLGRGWRKVLPFKDAIAAGLVGLKKAIETHNPEKGAFSTHAVNCIAGEISNEVRSRVSKGVSMDARSRRTGLSLYETLARQPFDASFQSDLHVLLRHRGARFEHALVYALRKMFGHSNLEVTRHLNRQGVKVSYQAVSYVFQRARQMIMEAKKGG